MNKRAQLLSLATFTALSLLSTAPRADNDPYIVADAGYNRTEDRIAPLSCAEATKAAWFYRQLQLTDGDTSPDFPKPAECQPEMVAQGDDAK